jgi:hypothetical protein
LVTKPTFYTVSNAQYFPGTVALLNSLRLTGNLGELVVLDVDLTASQRKLLRGHCTLVKVPHEVAINPLLLKPFPAVLEPDGVVVIIDSDIIVTKSLAHLVEDARQGRICVFPDAQSDRWFAEWKDLFDLGGSLRRQPYVNSGFVAFSTARWPALLHRWRSLAECIDSSSTRAGGAARDTPLWDGDQDALNAILMSEIPEDALAMRPVHEAPTSYSDRRRMRVVDIDRLLCTYDDRSSLFVHAAGTPKPWEGTSWERRIWKDGYVQLLPRVLFADDATVKLRPADVPLWVRPGRLAQLATYGLDVGHSLLRLAPATLRRRAPAALHQLASRSR